MRALGTESIRKAWFPCLSAPGAPKKTLLGRCGVSPLEGVAEAGAGVVCRRTLKTGEGLPRLTQGGLGYEKKVRRRRMCGRYGRKGDNKQKIA